MCLSEVCGYIPFEIVCVYLCVCVCVLSRTRREFTTAGVAAGVAAGFNAPVGGLLFAMEDLSSFWGKRIAWQTFFCATVATATAQLFNTAFTGFQYSGRFGLFAVSV